MVEDLKTSRRTLVEDLRSKVSALDIDNSCRRVTPQMASEPRKLQNSSSMPNLKSTVRGAAGFGISGRVNGQTTPSQSCGSSLGNPDMADNYAESSASTATQGLHRSGFGASSTLKASATN